MNNLATDINDVWIEKDSPGSTIIELFVFGLIILIFGFVFLVVYRVNHTSNAANPAKSTSSTSSDIAKDTPPQGSPPVSIPSSSSSSPAAAAVNQNIISISPIGAKITVPDSIKDLTYHSTTGVSGVISVTFSTTTLTNDAPSCSASVGEGAFDVLVKGNGQYSSSSDGGLIKQEPTFYIAYILPSGPCAKGLSPTIQTLLDQQSADFYTALSSVQVTS